MRVEDKLYFAPGIWFSDVDLDGPHLPDQFRQRVDGFYIKPAEECTQCVNHAFAAGVLLVTCIDALARLRFPTISDRQSGKRFKEFVRKELPSFSDDKLADRFYRELRNGLVHQGTLNEGAQFSLDFDETVRQCDGILIVNPKCLAKEVSSALDSYVRLLQEKETERQRLAGKLKEDHTKDFQAARA
jgi:hypothetical protein